MINGRDSDASAANTAPRQVARGAGYRAIVRHSEMGVIGAVASIPGALYNATTTAATSATRPATALYHATTTAASSATRFATRKLTEKTFKVALRRALEQLCERFDLEDYGDQTGEGRTSVVARNLVLKRASLDALLSRVGLRLADGAGDPQAPCTIQC